GEAALGAIVGAGEAAAQRAALGPVASVCADALLGRDGAGEEPARLAAGVVDLGAHEQAHVVAGDAGGEQVGHGALGVGGGGIWLAESGHAPTVRPRGAALRVGGAAPR